MTTRHQDDTELGYPRQKERLSLRSKTRRRKGPIGFISKAIRRHHSLFNTSRFAIALVFFYLALDVFSSKKWDDAGNYKEQTCRHFKPIDPNPDLSKLSPKRRERFRSVQLAVRHAWKGYKDIATLDSFWSRGSAFIPHDDLSPVSKKGHNWLHYGATLHDSIDTLYLANMTQEFDQAVYWLTSYDIQTTSPQATKTFEYSLRILGGLLGAYSLSGDVRLFAAAKNAADAILEGPFWASPTILPRPFNVLAPSASTPNCYTWLWDWKATIQRLYMAAYTIGRNRFTKEHQTNSLAGFGSFGMEFSFISTVSGDEKYRKVNDRLFHHVQAYEKGGIVPNSWNVLTGKPQNHDGSLGSGSDSFYEYLIKIPVLNRCYYDADMEIYTQPCTDSDKDHWRLYETMVKESLAPFHAKRDSIGVDLPHKGSQQQVFPVDNGNSYDHLLCFLPGMLSLGASTKYTLGADSSFYKDKDYLLARQMLDGCTAIYKDSKTDISPDTGHLNPGKFTPVDSSYYLRPEYVESLFVNYRLTQDQELQELAWDVFQSIEKYCKIPSGGYAGLKDVNDPTKGYVDDMPSYFLAETLKYLLLVFGPDDYVPLDEFVFTTEAHPFRKLKTLESEDDALPYCVLQCRPPTPVPWTLLCIGASIISICMGMYKLIRKVARKGISAFVDDKAKPM